MKKQQYIVFGLNRFGTSVARTLAAAGNEVVAVDQDADRVAQIADDVSYAVQVDVADEDALAGCRGRTMRYSPPRRAASPPCRRRCRRCAPAAS